MVPAKTGVGVARGRHGKATTRTPQQLVALALTMLSIVTLSFVEIPAFVGWLKFDLTGILSMLAALVFGPGPAIAITILGWLPHLFFDPLGTFISAFTMSCCIAVVGALCGARPSMGRAAAGLAAGMAAFVLLALILNLLITPLYNAMPMGEVATLIMPVLLPFNLVKVAYTMAATLLLYRPAQRLCDRL
jgi:riboflavin transporter FmnP